MSGTGSRVSRKRALLVKGIKEANITPSQFNIFVGQNNHGKTNLFEALDRKKVAVPFTLYPSLPFTPEAPIFMGTHDWTRMN